MKTLILSLALVAFAAPAAMAQVGSNTATIGVMFNQADGSHNDQSNFAAIDQRSSVAARPGMFGPSAAGAKNDATIGALVNVAHGRGNMQSNDAEISQRAKVGGSPFARTGTMNTGTIGALANSAEGRRNVQGNTAIIDQKGAAKPDRGFGRGFEPVRVLEEVPVDGPAL